MTEQQMRPKVKGRKRQKVDTEIKLDEEDTFSPAHAKDKDFDLDLDAAKFQGKKGQAGSRTKTPPKEPDPTR